MALLVVGVVDAALVCLDFVASVLIRLPVLQPPRCLVGLVLPGARDDGAFAACEAFLVVLGSLPVRSPDLSLALRGTLVVAIVMSQVFV